MYVSVSPGSASGLCQRRSHAGAWSGASLCQKPLRADAVGEAVHVHRPVGQVRQHRRRRRGVVTDQVALGQRPPAAVPRREQHLVEVRQPQLSSAELPGPRSCRAVEGGEFVVGGRRPDASGSPRGGGRRGTSSLVRPDFTDRGWSSGCQPATACVVALVEQQPLLALRRPRPRRTSAKRPASFSPVSVEMEVAALDLRQRVVAPGQAPRAPVPHDDVAAAVLAGGDDAFEVEVVERVVLDVHRQPARLRIERRTFRHGPADQHAGGLEPQVVVQVGWPGGAAPRSATRPASVAVKPSGSAVIEKSRFARYRASRSATSRSRTGMPLTYPTRRRTTSEHRERRPRSGSAGSSGANVGCSVAARSCHSGAGRDVAAETS